MVATSLLRSRFFTIFLGHTTPCMAYITVVIRSRLVELDQSLEEAAMDLGARPLKIFCHHFAFDCLPLLQASYSALPCLWMICQYLIPLRYRFIHIAAGYFLQDQVGSRSSDECLGNHPDRHHRNIGHHRQLLDDEAGNQAQPRSGRSLPPRKIGCRESKLINKAG